MISEAHRVLQAMNEHRWRSQNNKTRVVFVFLFVWCHGCDSTVVRSPDEQDYGK